MSIQRLRVRRLRRNPVSKLAAKDVMQLVKLTEAFVAHHILVQLPVVAGVNVK